MIVLFLGVIAMGMGLPIRAVGVYAWIGAKVLGLLLYSAWTKAANESLASLKSKRKRRKSDRESRGEYNWLDQLRVLPCSDRRKAASLCCLLSIIPALPVSMGLVTVLPANLAWAGWLVVGLSQFVAFKLYRRWMTSALGLGSEPNVSQ